MVQKKKDQLLSFNFDFLNEMIPVIKQIMFD